jgi:hypothetical protein
MTEHMHMHHDGGNINGGREGEGGQQGVGEKDGEYTGTGSLTSEDLQVTLTLLQDTLLIGGAMFDRRLGSRVPGNRFVHMICNI